MLKLATKDEIAIPGTPRLSLKVRKVRVGRCRRMDSKVHHNSGQVVPLLRRKIRRGWRKLLAMRSGIAKRQ